MQYKWVIFATTVQGFGAPPVYTIVWYPVSGIRAMNYRNLYIKCESIKIDRLKNIKDGYDFSPA
jgi:hypothetical protein